MFIIIDKRSTSNSYYSTCYKYDSKFHTYILEIPVVEDIVGGSVKLPVVSHPTILPTVLMTCTVYDTVELGCNNDNIKLSVVLTIYGFVIMCLTLLIS